MDSPDYRAIEREAADQTANSGLKAELRFGKMHLLADHCEGWSVAEGHDRKQTARFLGRADGLRRLAETVGPDWDPPLPGPLSLIGSIAQILSGDQEEVSFGGVKATVPSKAAVTQASILLGPIREWIPPLTQAQRFVLIAMLERASKDQRLSAETRAKTERNAHNLRQIIRMKAKREAEMRAKWRFDDFG